MWSFTPTSGGGTSVSMGEDLSASGLVATSAAARETEFVGVLRQLKSCVESRCSAAPAAETILNAGTVVTHRSSPSITPAAQWKLLADGSPRAKVVNNLTHWRLFNMGKFADWTPPLTHAVEKATKARRIKTLLATKAGLADPKTRYVSSLAALDHDSSLLWFFCLSLAAASVAYTEETSMARLALEGERKKRSALASVVAQELDVEPRQHWERLLKCVESATENLAQAVAAGKSPLPPPRGLFGKLSRRFSEGTTPATAEEQQGMEKALAELEPLLARLRSVVEEMEKGE